MKRVFLCFGWILFLVSCQPKSDQNLNTDKVYSEDILPEVTQNVQVKSKDEEINLEPSTTFVVGNSSVVTTPVPIYIGHLAPGPNEIYSKDEYNNLAPSLGWSATVPSVCFSLYPRPFMEPGDFYSMEEWLENVDFRINNKIIEKYHSLLITDMEGITRYDLETGEVVWKLPDGSPYGLCYAANLEPGIHSCEISIEKTSGEMITYTWSFTITE